MTVEEGILRKTERAMIQNICDVKLADRKTASELIGRLGLKETVLRVAKRKKLMGHVVRREDDEHVKKVWDLEVNVRQYRGRQKTKWKDMVNRDNFLFSLYNL